MKILAVIPARAGSKGIPNKNIKLLNERPLIYYSIKNAISSNYISDIIVTTDSEEVEIIAKQMGVKIKKRKGSLCGDSVTLDSVIYDASKDEEVDYVITLQPTSPMLKSSTIDAAIEYMLKNKMDTVISVVNKPHLAWKEDHVNNKYPNYTERLNRQYLPPYYLETGSFLITKKSVINENTRIGRKIDVFEVSDLEGIDIDNYFDFKLCAEMMKNPTVGLYVNGNNKRGLGHIYRCLELADEFYVKPDIYYDVNETNATSFGNTTHNIIGVRGMEELFDCIKKRKYEIFINDILNTNLEYMNKLRKINPSQKIINFEDVGEGTMRADLIINALYNDSTFSKMKTGKDYYICSKLFMFYSPIKIMENVKSIFISFGGADPSNYTDRLLDIINKEKYKEYKFKIVLGRAKNNVLELMKQKSENIEIYYDIKNMPEIMSDCDIALTSRGRTGYELAILGIPTIAMAQNEMEEKHRFISHENGYNYLGLSPSDSLIEANLDAYIMLTKEEREKIQKDLLKHDLKNGRKKVMTLINNLL